MLETNLESNSQINYNFLFILKTNLIIKFVVCKMVSKYNQHSE